MLQQLGRYRITGKLGAGGMGVVYLAEDSVLGRRVALKTIRLLEGTDPSTHQDLAERFLREARIVAQMDHPGIVSIYDFGTEGETAYFVLEYVAGSNLANRLEQSPKLDRAVCTRALSEAASALDYAHKRGVVHRDVKPANLLLTEDGRVKVADFGIAKLSGSTTMTATGMLMGTVEYMSPEQIRGENVDGRSDQYSLAVVAYQLVTGKRPFQADSTITLAHMIVYEKPAPASAGNQGGVTLSVDAVLARGLDKQPSARYATCGEFVRDLEQAWLGVASRVPEPATSPAFRETATVEYPLPRQSPPAPAVANPAPPHAPPPLPMPPSPAPVPVAATPVPAATVPAASSSSKKLLWGIVAVFLVIAGIGIVVLVKLGPSLIRNLMPASSETATASQSTPTPPKAAPATSAPSTPQQTAPTETPATQPPLKTPPASLPGRRRASPEEEKAESDEAKSASSKGVSAPVAAATLEKKATSGDIRTMVQTGDAFANGRGGNPDYAKAKQWYEKAASKGDAGAMARLGDLYQKGLGVSRDYDAARTWYEQSAAKDFREAMDRLGDLYYQGIGVQRNYGTAKQWYEKAAQRGFPLAFLHLARLYRYGNGVPLDCDIARNWYEEAANENNNNAMLMLGDLYSEGCIGFRDDREKAREWYTKAAQAGNELANDKLQKLK